MEQNLNKLGNCDACKKNQAKYTCPKCEFHTCSLECVKFHKNQTQCDGKRHRCAYKTISKMTNLDLKSDYMLLEETTRAISEYAHDPSKQLTRYNKPLPKHLLKLKGAAFKRKIFLSYLPPHFSKHKENTTFYKWNENIIFWKVDWIFTQCEFFKITSNRINENDSIAKTVTELIDENPEKLKFYKSAGLNDIDIYLHADNKPKESVYLLDSTLTLKENLSKKNIIEYPIIYLVLKDCRGSFKIIDSDDELEESQNEPKKRKINETDNHLNYFNCNSSEEDD